MSFSIFIKVPALLICLWFSAINLYANHFDRTKTQLNNTESQYAYKQHSPLEDPDFVKRFLERFQRGKDRIVGGDSVDINDYPWQVSLQLMPVYGGAHFCGGTIVDDEWIITASHCLVFDDNGSDYYLQPTDFRVRAGFSHLDSPSQGSFYNVAEIILHPEYTTDSFQYDLALLRVSDVFDLDHPGKAIVDIIRQPDVTAGLTDPGTEGWVSGWGTLSFGGSSPNQLHAVEVPIMSGTASYPPSMITDDMLLAGAAGLDACQGDSGGPLVVPDGIGWYKLAGVVSWGNGCGLPGYPGVYAKVSWFENWINQYIETESHVEPMPFTEDFSGLSNGEMPEHWTRTHINWGAWNTNHADGAAAPELRFNWSPAEVGIFRAATPLIDASEAESVNLSFMQSINDYQGDYYIRIQTSFDGENWVDQWHTYIDPTKNTQNINRESGKQKNDPVEMNISLENVAGQEFYIAFVFDGNSFNINQWYLDDIVVDMPPQPEPENIMLIRDVTATAGDVVTIEIEILNDEDFTGFNLTIPPVEDFTYIPGSEQLFRKTDHTVAMIETESNNELKIIAFSFTNSNFIGNEGVVLSFDMQAPLVPGEYPISIIDAVIGNISMQDILTGTLDGIITLEDHTTEPENIMLARDITATAGDVVTVEIEILNDEKFAGFNLTIPLQEGFELIPGSGQLFRKTDHVFAKAIYPGTNNIMIISYSLTNSSYLGNEGVIFSFDIQTPTAPGEYPVSIIDAVIGNTDLENIITGVIDGNLTLYEQDGDTEDHLEIADMIISSGETECFDAENTITVAGGNSFFIVQDGGSVTLIAGEKITLMPGVKVEHGGHLHARIAESDDDFCGIPKATEIVFDNGDPGNSSINYDQQPVIESLFKVYPNPTDGVFTLEMNRLNENTPIDMEVYGLISGSIISKTLPAQNMHTINMTAATPGMYIIRVVQGDQVGVERIIKR